jgi:hypothetical protein
MAVCQQQSSLQKQNRIFIWEFFSGLCQGHGISPKETQKNKGFLPHPYLMFLLQNQKCHATENIICIFVCIKITFMTLPKAWHVPKETQENISFFHPQLKVSVAELQMLRSKKHGMYNCMYKSM